MVYFHLAECVLLRPGSISGRQSVFRHVLVNFRSAECVPPCPGLISSWQSTSGPLESVLIKNIKLRAHYILFPKICGRTYEHTNEHTNIRTNIRKKNVTSKYPFRINARDTKITVYYYKNPENCKVYPPKTTRDVL